MAQLQLILASSPRLLLERAADEFLAPLQPSASSPFVTPGYWLAVRQGGLRDDLLALAAARGVRGWFDPPLCVFAQLPEILTGRAGGGLPDYERAVLIEQILRMKATHAIARNGHSVFVDSVDRMFGDLMSEGVDPQFFEEVLNRQPERDAFQQRRDQDLSAAFREYVARIGSDRSADPRARWIHAAEVIRLDPAALAERLGRRREIRLLGLQDLRGGWRTLLRALRASPALDHIRIYTSVHLAEKEGLNCDETLVLDEPVTLPRALFSGNESVTSTPTIRILSAPDVDREVEQVAVRIRALIDAGQVPDRIAVVARNARPYGNLVLNALKRTGISATMRQRTAFTAIPVVRSVLSLFSVASENWSRHGLVELAGQPYFGFHLDAYVLNYIGYRKRVEGLDNWIQAIQALQREAETAERLEARGEKQESWSKATPRSDRITDALATFGEFVARAAVLDLRRTLMEWLEWLEDRVLGKEWDIEARLYSMPGDRWDVVRWDLAGLRGIRTIVAQWRSALEKWGGGEEHLEVAEMEVRLREMFSGDVALWTHARHSVQILEGLAAAHRIFDHVFVVGLTSGGFPLRTPLSPFHDESECAALAGAGLPLETRAQWETRERELFRAIVATAGQSLTLTVPRLDAKGAETVPSAFLEEVAEITGTATDVVSTRDVITRGIASLPGRDAVEYATHGATIERLRATGQLSAYNGRIEAPDMMQQISERLGENRVWSATQLESFAKCPWSYFSGRLLYLEKLEDPDIDIDPRVRGSLLHDALHRFFDKARERESGPVFLVPEDLNDWAFELVRKSLDEAIEGSDEEIWLGQPALRETKRAELRRMLMKYLEEEAHRNLDLISKGHKAYTRVLRTAVDAHEEEFKDVALVLNGERIRVRGMIDRIEVSIDERVPSAQWLAAVDYKTSKWSAPGGGDKDAWEDGVVLQVPLYAQVLTQLRPGSKVARVEYRAIRGGERVHTLELVQVKKDGNRYTLEEKPDEKAKMQAALDAIGQHVRRARNGEFPAQPAPSCMCPSFCHAWEICRVKGGPRQKW